MAILRIATSPADFTSFSGFLATNNIYFDDTRVANGMGFTSNDTGSILFPAAAGTSTWIHFAFAQNSGNSSSADIAYIQDGSGNYLFGLEESFGRLSWTVSGDTSSESNTFDNGYQNLVIMDIQLIVNGTTDITLNAYLNSALMYTATVANTGGKGNPQRLFFQGTDAGEDFVFSEVIIADEDTRGFRLREFKPQSFGVFQQWDGDISAVTDDLLTTGISTTVADERSSFGLNNLENIETGDLINRVVAQTYAQRGASGLTSMNHFFRYDNGTIQDSSDIALTTTGDWYVEEFINNPNTAAPWAPADLAGIQLGVRARA